MTNLSAVSVEGVQVSVAMHELEHPLVLSSGTVTELPEVTVTLTVTDGDASGTGYGAVNLSDVWAWPDPNTSSAAKQQAMIAYAQHVGASLTHRLGDPAHPLELGLRLHESVLADNDTELPALARSVCGSAFDAAVHDAAGRMAGCSAFAFYDEAAPVPSADHLFDGGAIAAVRAVLRPPALSLPGWWLIAPGDDLEDVGHAAKRSGMTQFKVKLAGADPKADAQRLAEIYSAACDWGESPRLSVDTNEGSESPDVVLAFLDAIETINPAALSAVAYLEQPTPRASLHEFDWRAVSDRVPMLIDEALTSVEDLEVAADKGWSGYALKSCKGHSFALVSAAWAAQRGMVVSVQDLTNIGRSAIHSYLLAAHLPSINGVELNSPQYLPRANNPWLPRLHGLFEPREGVHALDTSGIVGLGGDL